MPKEREGDMSGTSQSRPPLTTHVSQESDSQFSDQASQQQQRGQKHHNKHVAGPGRLHTRVPSSKALPKHNRANSSTKMNAAQAAALRRLASPSPERERPSLTASHRRHTSDVKLPSNNSATNLKKNLSQTTLKRNRSHVEVGKRVKSATNIKRSSSHKELTKHKGGAKGQVHFDLGNDGQEDEGEWVDASGSASPYLSRRGSIVGSTHGSTKAPASTEASPRPQTQAPVSAEASSRPQTPPTRSAVSGDEDRTPERATVQHKINLTSRLLQRAPSQGAPPKMSEQPARGRPISSPESNISRGSSTVYGTPKASRPYGGDTLVESQRDELVSRFVQGPGAPSVNPDTGSFYSPTPPGGPSSANERPRRPRSLQNFQGEHLNAEVDEPPQEEDSALAPRTQRGPVYRAPPAESSRTQQKLNLQRASSTMESAQAGGGVGAAGASPLVGGGVYDTRDPRIGKTLDRTGMEYLVVRRYQNPIARSIARLQQLPDADKRRPIPKPNGQATNASTHSSRVSQLSGAVGQPASSSLGDAQRSRPATPRRSTSIQTNGGSSSYEPEEQGRDVDGDNDGVAALLRNLWDKNMNLSASQ